MKALCLVWFLAGCGVTAHGPAVVIEREITRVPPDLTDCPNPPGPVTAPKPPRTIQSLVDWTVAVEAARVESARTASLCRQRLLTLNSLVGRHGDVEK